MALEFDNAARNYWVAKDGEDVYEIFAATGRKMHGYYAFKNGTIALVGSAPEFWTAVAACNLERRTQEWYSRNPENAERNAHYRALRDANRKRTYRPSRRRPVLFKG